MIIGEEIKLRQLLLAGMPAQAPMEGFTAGWPCLISSSKAPDSLAGNNYHFKASS